MSENTRKPEDTIRYLNKRYILTSQLEKRGSEYIIYNGFDIICDLNKRIGNNKYLENLDVSDDPDDCKEAKNFYVKKFDFYKENNYRGDTIISFNTIAGYMIKCTTEYSNLLKENVYRSVSKDKQEKNLSMILGSNSIDASINISDDLKKKLGGDVSKALKKKFCEFYYLYHTKANFMPLPDEGWNSGHNLNKRKNEIFNDFPDSFFKYVKYVKDDKSDLEDDKLKLLNSALKKGEKNKKYIDNFNNWNVYVKKNYLQPLFKDEKYTDFIILEPQNSKIIEDINTFLDNAIKFILKRGLLLQIHDLASDIVKESTNKESIIAEIKKNIIKKYGNNEKTIIDELFNKESKEFTNFIKQILKEYNIYEKYKKNVLKNKKMDRQSFLDIVSTGQDIFFTCGGNNYWYQGYTEGNEFHMEVLKYNSENVDIESKWTKKTDKEKNNIKNAFNEFIEDVEPKTENPFEVFYR